jgi:hypothetical protein
MKDQNMRFDEIFNEMINVEIVNKKFILIIIKEIRSNRIIFNHKHKLQNNMLGIQEQYEQRC